MTLSRHTSFRPIGQILALDVHPALHRAGRLPLRVSCIGSVCNDDGDAVREQTFGLGEVSSPEEAMRLAARVVSRGAFHTDRVAPPQVQPNMAVIQDRNHGLVLAGDIRAGVVVWQQPVASDAEARRIVTEASRLRGQAFAADGRGDRTAARGLRARSFLLEARLVDPVWREVAAALLRLPQAA